MLRTARSTILELDASSPLDDNTNGRLVHIYSALHGHDGLSDNTFGGVIGVRKGAFSIRRTTESYQWIEHESEEETRISSTHVKRVRSYSYNKRWRTSSPAYLSGPGAPHNPTPRLEPGVVTTLAEDLTLDNGVVVPSELLAQLKEPWIQVPLNAHASGGMPAGVAIAPLADSNDGARSLYLPISGVSLNEFGRRADSMPPRVRLPREVESTLNFERIGTERPPLPTLVLPPKPVVGDARVTFHEQLIPPEGVSIIAQQASHGRLMPWSAPRTGLQLFALVSGRHSASAMLRQLGQRHARAKWLRRALGASLMCAGVYLSLEWLPSLVAIAPLIGRTVAPLAAAATGVAAVASGLSASTLVIGAAWVRFRPIKGLAMLTLAISAFKVVTSERLHSPAEAKLMPQDSA